MKTAYLITTFNRSEACHRLINQLYGKGDIYLVNDGSKGYNWIKDYKIFYYKNKKNLGKQGFYQTITKLWSMAGFDYDFYFNLQDDSLPVDNFEMKAIKTWMQIPDHRKMCLNIFVEKSRFNKPCWTGMLPIESNDYRQTGWVDMHFIAQREFYEYFGCRIPDPCIDYKLKPTMSSGVGMHISKRLAKDGFTMYQTKTSLLIPQPEAFESQMNNWRTDRKINEVIL